MRHKTTVYLDDDLVREVKVEAAQRGTSLSHILEEALLARRTGATVRRRSPEWAGSFGSVEVTGESSEDLIRTELGRHDR